MHNRYQFNLLANNSLLTNALTPLLNCAWHYQDDYFSTVIDLNTLDDSVAQALLHALPSLNIDQSYYNIDNNQLTLYLPERYTPFFSLAPEIANNLPLDSSPPLEAVRFFMQATWNYNALDNTVRTAFDKQTSNGLIANTINSYVNQLNLYLSEPIDSYDEEITDTVYLIMTLSAWEYIKSLADYYQIPYTINSVRNSNETASEQQLAYTPLPDYPQPAQHINTHHNQHANVQTSVPVTELDLAWHDMRWFQNDNQLIGIVVDYNHNREKPLTQYLQRLLAGSPNQTWSLERGENFLKISIPIEFKPLVLPRNPQLNPLTTLPNIKPSFKAKHRVSLQGHLKNLTAGNFFTDGNIFTVILPNQVTPVVNLAKKQYTALAQYFKDYFKKIYLGEPKSEYDDNYSRFTFTAEQFNHLYYPCDYIQSLAIRPTASITEKKGTNAADNLMPQTPNSSQVVTPKAQFASSTALSLVKRALIYHHNNLIYIYFPPNADSADKLKLLEALRNAMKYYYGNQIIPKQDNVSKNKQTFLILPKELFEYFFTCNFTLPLPQNQDNRLKRKAEGSVTESSANKKVKLFFTAESLPTMQSLADYYQKFTWQIDANRQFLMASIPNENKNVSDFVQGLNKLYGSNNKLATLILSETLAVVKIPVEWQEFLKTNITPSRGNI